MITFILSIVLLVLGYVFYSKFIGERIAVNPKRITPACALEDGVDPSAVP